MSAGFDLLKTHRERAERDRKSAASFSESDAHRIAIMIGAERRTKLGFSLSLSLGKRGYPIPCDRTVVVVVVVKVVVLVLVLHTLVLSAITFRKTDE